MQWGMHERAAAGGHGTCSGLPGGRALFALGGVSAAVSLNLECRRDSPTRRWLMQEGRTAHWSCFSVPV